MPLFATLLFFFFKSHLALLRLAGIISNKPRAIPTVVKQWWADYEMDPAAAVGKLTNMMIEVRFSVTLRRYVVFPSLPSRTYFA
jgi:hypothetical protein